MHELEKNDFLKWALANWRRQMPCQNESKVDEDEKMADEDKEKADEETNEIYPLSLMTI